MAIMPSSTALDFINTHDMICSMQILYKNILLKHTVNILNFKSIFNLFFLFIFLIAMVLLSKIQKRLFFFKLKVLYLYSQLGFIIFYSFYLMKSSPFNCFCCSSDPSPGDSALQVFHKLPLINYTDPNLQEKQLQRRQSQNISNNLPSSTLKDSDQNVNLILKDMRENIVKKILKSNYSQLTRKYKDKTEKWTDPDFPPSQQSIGNVRELKKQCTWKRVEQVLRHPQFISGKIEPADIIQGSVGDCYFLSSISALAEKNYRIKNLFPSLDLNKSGIYMARILHQGILRQVVVDDYIPVNDRNQPVFAKPAGGREIWVMILQKCWAKLFGSYGAIEGGLPNEVLHDISGAPTFYRSISQNKVKQEKLWNDMLREYQKGSVLCCGTKTDPSIEKAGLILGHAYTILGVYESPHRMIKVRNPWGKREWNGRASDQDHQFWSKIAAREKQRLGYVERNEGKFFMLWQDFFTYFALVDICKIDDNANYFFFENEFNSHHGEVFEFSTTGGDAFVGLSQKSIRLEKPEEQKGYSRVFIIVSKEEQTEDGTQYTYVNSGSSYFFSDFYIEMQNLQSGKYVVFAKIDWHNEGKEKATLSLYSNSKVKLYRSSQQKHKNLLFKTFLDHARNEKRKKVFCYNPSEWMCYNVLLDQCGYGYLTFHLSEKSTKKVGIEIDEQQFIDRKLKLKKPYKGKGKIKLKVLPGQQIIVLFRIISKQFPTNINLPPPKFYNLV